jgi:hypothetical protein
MIERVIYTSGADDDIAESYDWFENREPGLGEEFLRCVEACVLTIQRHPQSYPVAVDNFRRALVRRFPFEFFMKLRVSPSTRSFIVPKTRRNGTAVLGLAICKLGLSFLL